MSDATLSPEQLQVINALSEGVNMTDAAAQAGVHRNTIANWRRNSLFFREALTDAQYDRALLSRDHAEVRLDLAFAALDSVLNDPKASASVRLKAALFIIDKACTPPLPRKHAPREIELEKDEVRASQPDVHPMHNHAQAAATVCENPPSVHNHAQNAQSPFRHETQKVGRNEACPCGSSRKFKHCCLNKPQAANQSSAA